MKNKKIGNEVEFRFAGSKRKGTIESYRVIDFERFIMIRSNGRLYPVKDKNK